MNRRPLRPWLCAGFVLALVVACVPGGEAATRAERIRPPEAAGAEPAAGEVRALVRLVNRHRAAIGCGPLAWDPRLASVARRHSEAMARSGFFSHVDRAGNDPFDRMSRAGIRFHAAAENIAAGQSSAHEVYEAWMGSRGHRENIENCLYTHHGIALVRGRWTHLFAKY